MTTEGLIYVVGHKNPDLDSICSAIAYAALKDATGVAGYVAARCGNSNPRIEAVMKRFGCVLPVYISDVSPRVHDLMTVNPFAVTLGATCAEALHLLDQHRLNVLPVVSSERRAVGTLALAELGHYFIPRPDELRTKRRIHTSLSRIARSLNATALCLVDGDRCEDLIVRIGAMDIGTFGTISARDNVLPRETIIIVGDRPDVQQRAIESGVRALIISGNLPVAPDVVACAQARGVSILVSAHDTATTAWYAQTASTIDQLVDRVFVPLGPNVRIADVRERYTRDSPHARMVLDDDGRLLGILTKTDLLKRVPTRLVLVDHNELTQAVPGADEVTITEIIDHHRLGPIATPHPILFINEPVGSTCTIVADMFRRQGLKPAPGLAGIMMSGLISDTLLLQSPTSTPKDVEVLAWLETYSGIKAKALAELIFSSGSVILTSPPDQVVRSDFKIYEEDEVRFGVSQIEELGFDNFWQHAHAITEALVELRAEERLAFACLLVTDVNTQNSLMLVQGEEELMRRITYARTKQDEIFDLPGVVSRKKQLIPYLSGLLREMSVEASR